MSDKKFVNLDSTKHRPDPKNVYGSVIAQIQKDGVCPFCPEQLTKYHKNPILKTGDFWLVTENMYPYKGTEHHFLLIHKMHITHIKEITDKAWAELDSICNEIFKDYNVEGGSFLMRFGDSKYTGASVSHLHAHIIVAKPDENREPILARVG
jgi:ATP adenylyltransferase